MPGKVAARTANGAAALSDNLRSGFAGALDRNELAFQYQPVVDLATGRPVGFEALLRWSHPVFGVMQPLSFLPDAERSGQLIPVERWGLGEASRQLSFWRRTLPDFAALTMAVNLSAGHFDLEDVVANVQAALAVAALDPAALVVEMTESARLADPAATWRQFRGLTNLGVQVALDDFGTGYRGLDDLATLHPDIVKIDRRFVIGLSEALTGDGVVAQHLLRLALAQGIRTIAEGVESHAQVDHLLDGGCRLGQGYLFARPMWPAAVVPWVQDAVRRSSRARPHSGRPRASAGPTPLRNWPPLVDTGVMGQVADVTGEPPLRLLIIDDSPSDALLLETALRDSSLGKLTIETSTSLHDALRRLDESTYDCVLVDLGLPDSDGLSTFTQVAEQARTAAVVVVTALNDTHLAEEAVRLGAQDYLLKSEQRRGECGRAVDYAIRRTRVLQELQRARDEQLEAKDRFLSHVSHELRSPLSVVHQFASLLLDGVAGSLSVDQREFLTVLMRNVGQLKVMIDDLLEVSRAQRGRLAVDCQAVEIRVLLTDALASYRPAALERNLSLDVDAGELPTVIGDADRLREVLANVIENALKFTPAGGRITIEGVPDGDTVRLTVRDTGRGIRAQDQERIFEQFFQAEQSDEVSRGGLGLGLFVCRDLVQLQGGRMWAESDFGHGTAISFTIPVLSSTYVPEAC